MRAPVSTALSPPRLGGSGDAQSHHLGSEAADDGGEAAGRRDRSNIANSSSRTSSSSRRRRMGTTTKETAKGASFSSSLKQYCNARLLGNQNFAGIASWEAKCESLA